ncbi:putative lipid II flippase FtsW [Gammaproteobacteria bacterium]|nr:putative lipid II flippase FtsW [Gammaproteobacteria bacterium]
MLNRTIQMSPPIPYDKWLLLTVGGLMCIGLLMVASASIVISDNPFFYFYRQSFSIILGIISGIFVVQFKVSNWEKIGGFALLGIILLLILVLIPGLGHSVNGSSRWIGFGFFKIQISELAKLSIVIYLAGYLYRRNSEIKNKLKGFLKPILILVVVSYLLLLEPDFGGTVVIIITALGMMFLAGMRVKHFLTLLGLVFIGLAVIAVSEPYRIARLTSFLNPWASPFNSGYQLTQSLIAFGRGGWFGVGLGNSIQKLFYLPESYTDFLFAIIAEELGLIGMLFIISLFCILFWRIFSIGKRAQLLGRHFSGFLSYGVGIWLVIQFAVNIGVNSGILPTKGLTMPLISYGGSSMLINCIALALILRIDYENRMVALGLYNE